MITKNYKSIFSYLAALTTALFVVGCDQEENTDFSTLVPTAPTLSVTTDVSSKSLIEDDSVYEFTATLSTAQLVDVKLFITQVDGDATIGADYTVDGSIVIPAGATSAKGKITILSDDLIEETETVKIQIGDERTANAAIEPAFMDFTIMNYTEGDLAIDMSWAMASVTTDSSGDAIDPTDFADLRLLISSGPNNTDVIDGADGGSFETYVLSGTEPDGEYYVVADFYAVNSDIARDLDLSLEFNQAGVINGDSYDFSSALNSAISCSSIYYVLGKIIKAGDSYTFEYIGEKNPVTAAPFIGTATVLTDDWADDYVDGEITIEAGSNPFEFYVRMYSNPYIDNPDTAYLIVTIDPLTGNLTGVSNEPWNYGNATPVTATGTVDLCNRIIVLDLDYFYGGGTHYTGNILELQLN